MMLRGATLLAVLLLGAWSGASRAEEAVPGTDRSLKGDAVCTHCHDETEAKPVLSIYKTPHGVKADERTPGCQSCHGPSVARSEEHTSELQSLAYLVCRLLLEKKKPRVTYTHTYDC